MFGLMRFRCRPGSLQEERRWRLHYCGTCKVLGRRYGQRARLLLNHDTSFLAELLGALSGEDAEQWPRAYRSWNCMRLPDADQVPVLIGYAAAVNVLMSEYKVLDHEADSGRRRWRWARYYYSRAFRKARKDLAAFGFPVDQAGAILGRQEALEASAGVNCEQVAAPTAVVTGMVFRHGARLAHLDGKADALEQLGYRFGRMIYLIDAWQDFDRDARTGAFNALRACRLDRAWAAREIRSDAEALGTALDAIGAPLELRLRLRSNAEAVLGSPLRIFHACSTAARPTLRRQWKEAMERARGWRTPALAFALVAVMAFVFPRHARLAKSARECLSLGMNLMAFGGLLVAIAAGPLHAGGPQGRLKSCLNSCCGWCDCDDCACDGCCDCCGDGCCSCDC